MKIFYMLLGLMIMLIALLVEPFVILVMLYVTWNNHGSIVALLPVGFIIYCWFTPRNPEDRFLSAWKPQTMKDFWANWNGWGKGSPSDKEGG